MPDAADNIVQNIKDANPVSAMTGAVKGVAAKVEGDIEGAPAVLMQRPQAQAQFVNQHQEADNQGLLREYYQQHPEFASADPIRAKRLGIEPPPPKQQEPAQAQGQNPDQLNPGQKEKTPQAWGQEQQETEGASGSEAEPAPGLIGEGAAKIGEAAGMTPEHAATMGGIVNTTVGIASMLRGAPFLEGYKFAETPEQLALAAENARLGAGEGAGEAAPRAVTPETMYTTGTETPGKQVGPNVQKPLHEMSPEELEAAHVTAHTQEADQLRKITGWDDKKLGTYQRLINSESDKAYARAQSMERELSPDQQSMLEKWSLKSEHEGENNPSDVQGFKKALGDVDTESPEAMGDSLKYAITKLSNTPENPAEMTTEQQMAYAQVRHAGQIAQDNGWDLGQVSNAAVKGAAGRFSDPADAQFMLEKYLRPKAAGALPEPLAGDAQAAPGQPTGAVPPKEQPSPQPESVGAAALTSKRDMAEDMSVAHTMPDLIARAHETPLSKEEFNGFKVSPDSETGHPTLTEPVNMVDALRISHYAGQQVGALQDAAKAAQAEIDSGAENPALTKAFIQKTAEVRDEVLPVWSGMRHQIGLALKVLGRPTSDMRNLLLNTRDLLSEVDYSQPGQLMNKLANLKPEDQTAMLAKINQPNFWDHLSTLWQAQKLGPNTALKKWTSDAMMTVYQPVERYAAAAYSQTVGSGEITFSQANAYLRGGIGAIQRGMEIGRASERANKPLFDSQMGFGEAAHKALGSAGTRLEGTWLGHAYDLYANLIHELGGRRILYPDQTAKFIHYSAQLESNAMEAAEREGGSAAQRNAAFQHLRDNPTKDMQENAYDYARAQTFSSSMQQLKFVQEFRKTPAGRILLPFFPTPVNILSRGVQGVGLGPLTSQWRSMYAAGGAQRDLAMARNGLGLLMIGTLVHHWMAGRINGAPPTNPDMRKLWTASGHQPYSIELGNHTLDLGNLPEPFGDMLGLVADTANTAQQMPVDYDDPNTGILHQRLDNVGNSLTMALMGQIHNASFFRTLSDVVHFIGDDKSAPSDRINYLRDLAGGVVPTVATDIAHWWDPIHREIRGNLDQLKSEVPGVSTTLPSDVDLYGRDAVYPLGSAGMSLDLLSSPKATGIEHDPVTDELLRLQPTVPAAPKALGGPNRGPMSQDSPKYGTPLTPDEQHAFKVIRGQLKDEDGKDMHGSLADLMDSKGYKDSNDIVRRQMVDEIFTQRQGMAREFLQEKSTSLQGRMQHRQEQRGQMMGAQ